MVEIYHHACGVNSTYIKIKFKTTILKSSDYSDANILVKRTITIAEAGTNAAATQARKRNKHVTFKNVARFTDCISDINNSQVDNGKNLDGLMPMYNLIEYSHNDAKRSRSLCAIPKKYSK